ncbi:pseudouridine synthase [Acinetobacter rathckeae]|uniref:pseudouridine synthase n=1 Tax=Acinetobacter rathckeae TaxID=2605272 RepID=UPI0018A2FFCB|nr:pseudouridine synthase [Acinetobacter rathckeae]MBF7687628.1 pseudouridylate synthase [Acinetobacter rathckeae]MBF7695030.1 pseudouridylate synthase [Acinetobacter rathckeae]
MSLHDLKPPMIHGVSASRVVLPSHTHHKTIFEFLCAHFPHIQADEWQQRCDDGLVLNQALMPVNTYTPYQAQQYIFYYRFLEHEINVPFSHHIIFENDDLLVVDKPHFLTVSPTGRYVQQTLLVRLKQQTGIEDLSPIHRLDRETAGLVMFSKKPTNRAVYQQLFADRQVTKHYHAIARYTSNLSLPYQFQCHMKKGEPFYTMCIDPNLPANSETTIECIMHNQNYAKYLLKPSSGKQHQLRVHLNALNIPILYDPFYPVVTHKEEHDFSQPLQLLAYMLAFTDPITKQNMQFFSRQNLTLP